MIPEPLGSPWGPAGITGDAPRPQGYPGASKDPPRSPDHVYFGKYALRRTPRPPPDPWVALLYIYIYIYIYTNIYTVSALSIDQRRYINRGWSTFRRQMRQRSPGGLVGQKPRGLCSGPNQAQPNLAAKICMGLDGAQTTDFTSLRVMNA